MLLYNLTNVIIAFYISFSIIKIYPCDSCIYMIDK